MDKLLIAKASLHINAPLAKAQEALVHLELIKQYLFGTTVVSDWKEGYVAIRRSLDRAPSDGNAALAASAIERGAQQLSLVGTTHCGDHLQC